MLENRDQGGGEEIAALFSCFYDETGCTWSKNKRIGGKERSVLAKITHRILFVTPFDLSGPSFERFCKQLHPSLFPVCSIDAVSFVHQRNTRDVSVLHSAPGK